MVAHGEREGLQADHAAGLAGRAARLRAAVHQRPGLPQVQEEFRLADQGAARMADHRAAGPASNRILASRHIRLLVSCRSPIGMVRVRSGRSAEMTARQAAATSAGGQRGAGRPRAARGHDPHPGGHTTYLFTGWPVGAEESGKWHW